MSNEAVVVSNNETDIVKAPSNVSFNLSENVQKNLEGTGVIIGDMGTKISRVPIEKYKATTTKIDRIGFLTSQVMGVKSHYIEGNGSVICLGGKKCKACEVEGAPSVRYLFPIVIYSTDNDGNVVGKKVEMKILSAGDDLYKTITTIARGQTGMGGIDHVDLLVTCTDDQYQKITLTPCGEAAWRKSESIVQMLLEKWNENGEFAYMAVARKVDEQAMATLLNLGGGEQAGANSQVGGTFDAQKNQDLSSFFDS